MKKFVLISKDAMCKGYLPVYGNPIWNTPNLNDLAKQGTVFTEHYTAAPSTVMSFYSMCTGLFAHETNYEMYEKIQETFVGETLFCKLKELGYNCHILWDVSWMILKDYYDYFRNDVQIHTLNGFQQKVGAHFIHDGILIKNDTLTEETIKNFKFKAEEILNCQDNIFLWIHFPHVINGCVSYGSDIEVFDKCIGELRKLVPDNCIAITADHGNANGHKGRIGYGFDVYQPAINIPLITPRIDELFQYNEPTSSVDLYSILFKKEIIKRKFIYSDCAYKAQKSRKLAIISGNYKYIYNKKNNTEELYDLTFDPDEKLSLISDYIMDCDRHINTPLREVYYYPYWNELKKVREMFRKEKQRIWENGSYKVVIKSNLKDFARPVYDIITRKKI